MLCQAAKYSGLGLRLAKRPPAKERCQLCSTAWREAFAEQVDNSTLPEHSSHSRQLREAASAQQQAEQQGSREHTGPSDLNCAIEFDAASIACRACATQQSNLRSVASYARRISAASLACRACATLQSNLLPVASWECRAHPLLRYTHELGQQWRGMVVRRRFDRGAVREPMPRPNVYSSRPADAPVRLVAEDGSHRILPYKEALAEAKASGADLIEVAPTAQPPVVKLGKADKALYDRRLKEKELKRRQLEARRAQAVKEVRVGSQIAEHDLDLKLRLAKEFLDKGFRVKMTVLFKNAFRMDAGRKLNEVVNKVKPFAMVASPAANERIMQNTFAVFLSPLSDAAKETS